MNYKYDMNKLKHLKWLKNTTFKGFFSSDIHSELEKYKKSLELSGFDENDPNHKIVIAGDLVQGRLDDIKMIKFLFNLHKKGKLMVVMGNHDYDVAFENGRLKNNTFDRKWELKSRLWLKIHPYDLEFKDTRVVHGMWWPNLKNGGSAFDKMWGSVAMLGEPRSEWWNINTEEIKWKSIEEYEKDLDKDIIFGHFWTMILHRGFNHETLKGKTFHQKERSIESPDDLRIWKSKSGKLIGLDGGSYFNLGRVNVLVRNFTTTNTDICYKCKQDCDEYVCKNNIFI